MNIGGGGRGNATGTAKGLNSAAAGLRGAMMMFVLRFEEEVDAEGDVDVDVDKQGRRRRGLKSPGCSVAARSFVAARRPGGFNV